MKRGQVRKKRERENGTLSLGLTRILIRRRARTGRAVRLLRAVRRSQWLVRVNRRTDEALSQDFGAGDVPSTSGNTVNKGAVDMAAGKVNGYQAAVRQTAQNGSHSWFSGAGDVPSTGQNAADKPTGKAADKGNAAQQAVKPFTPPTVAEVAAFCRREGIGVDAERFCSFYASKGWTVGSQPMRDWRASARTWALRDRPQQKNKPELRPTVEIPGMLEL